MSEQMKSKMIRQARERFKKIYPCAKRADLADCFTTEGDMVMFWFNTADQSTHILTMALQQ
jgi:uncharacterized protein YqeY